MPRVHTVALLLCAQLAITAHVAAQSPSNAIKIRDSVYMAPVTGNVYLVTTPAGNVVIDTATAAMAPDAKKLLTAENHGPVKYIILTHGHADHIGGIELWKEAGTQIIAQRNYVEFVNYVTRLEGFFAPRNAAAFGGRPRDVGAWRGNFGAKIEPTVFFDEKYEFEFRRSEVRALQHARRNSRSSDRVDSGLQDCLHRRQLRGRRHP